jgi:FtsZ-binding cell division protein ZapB
MTENVAHVATNVTSVKRTESKYYTIGAVETMVQYTRGINQLIRTVGRHVLRDLHRLLGAMHDYAINSDHTRNAALGDAMGTCARNLRDALCNHLDLPDADRDEINNLRSTVTQRDATIQSLQVQVTQSTQLANVTQQTLQNVQNDVDRLRAENHDLRNRLRRSGRDVSGVNGSDDDDDDDEDGNGDDKSGGKRKAKHITPTKAAAAK